MDYTVMYIPLIINTIITRKTCSLKKISVFSCFNKLMLFLGKTSSQRFKSKTPTELALSSCPIYLRAVSDSAVPYL